MEFSELAADRCAVARVGSTRVMVPDAVPGDIADIEVRERRGAAHRGRLVRLVRPSALRVRPLCPLFDRCGGCQWQRVDAGAQAEYKGALVARALHQAGFNEISVRTVPAPSSWGYRTAGTYVPIEGDETAALGLHEPAGPSAAPIDGCLIQSPALQNVFEDMQRAWRALAPRLREGAPGTTICRQVRMRVGEASQEAAIGLFLDSAPAPAQRDAIVGEILAHVSHLVEIAAIAAPRVARAAGQMSARELRWGRPGVVETILGYWYRVPVLAPFPVTGRTASAAVTCALDALALDGDTTLLETEAGIGAYTLPAAAAVRSVIGRTAPEHLDTARYNAEWNEASNATFVDRSSNTLAAIVRSYGPFHRALVQLTPDSAPFETLNNGSVQRVVVVTNSPARLAQALPAADAAGFEARSVTVIDTHPQTSRAEIHATLDARRRAWAGATLRVLQGRAAPGPKPPRPVRPVPPSERQRPVFAPAVGSARGLRHDDPTNSKAT
ncbi:MAG TPA: hypothetical protein VKW09_06610 [bacterium]|nr:hypothetical protein [bacterium]